MIISLYASQAMWQQWAPVSFCQSHRNLVNKKAIAHERTFFIFFPHPFSPRVGLFGLMTLDGTLHLLCSAAMQRTSTSTWLSLIFQCSRSNTTPAQNVWKERNGSAIYGTKLDFEVELVPGFLRCILLWTSKHPHAVGSTPEEVSQCKFSWAKTSRSLKSQMTSWETPQNKHTSSTSSYISEPQKKKAFFKHNNFKKLCLLKENHGNHWISRSSLQVATSKFRGSLSGVTACRKDTKTGAFYSDWFWMILDILTSWSTKWKKARMKKELWKKMWENVEKPWGHDQAAILLEHFKAVARRSRLLQGTLQPQLLQMSQTGQGIQLLAIHGFKMLNETWKDGNMENGATPIIIHHSFLYGQPYRNNHLA